MAFAAFIRTAVFNDALPGLSVRQDSTSGVAYEALGPNTVPYYVGSRVGEAENVYEVVPITDGVEIRMGAGGGAAPDVILRRNTANVLTIIGTLSATFSSPVFTTQITLQQTTADYTITWADPAAARAYVIPDLGADAQFALSDAVLTASSVVFVGANGILSEDNVGLFFDAVNNKLGINVGSPSHRLHLEEAVDAVALTLLVYHTSTVGGNATIEINTKSASTGDPLLLLNIVGGTRWIVGVDNSAGDLLLLSAGTELSSGNRLFQLSDSGGGSGSGSVSIGTGAGSSVRFTLQDTADVDFRFTHSGAANTANVTRITSQLKTSFTDRVAVDIRSSFSNITDASRQGLYEIDVAVAGIMTTVFQIDGATVTINGTIITGSLNPLVDDANNTGITQVLALTHTTSGVPGIGIGVGMQFIAETAAGNNEIGAVIDVVTTNVGSGAEAFDLVFRTMLAGAAAAERMRITGTNVILPDNNAIALGDGADSRIYYDGTDTFWDLHAVGSGGLMIALAAGFPGPDLGVVHIWHGDAGAVTANNTPGLIIENSSSTALHLLSTAATIGYIVFGSPVSNIQGIISYNHATDVMGFNVGVTNRLQLTATAMAFQQATVISALGNLTIRASAGNDVILGDDVTILTLDGGTDFGIFNGGLIVNEDGTSGGDFRVESESFNEMFLVDASLNAIAVGRTAISGTHFILGGNVVSSGSSAARALYLASTLLPGPTGDALMLRVQPTITASGSAGTHSLIAGISIDTGVVTTGVAGVTNTAMLYIKAAFTATVTGANYSIWVDAGPTRLDGPLIIDGAFTIQANSAIEIGFAVVDTSLTIGTSGSIILPYLRAAVSIGTDTLFGNLNGAMAVLSDSAGGDTIEARVEGAWVSVALAGSLIHRQVSNWPSDAWVHPDQVVNGVLNETICIICGKQMVVGDSIIEYANYDRGITDLHTIPGHTHLERNPVIVKLEEKTSEIGELRKEISELRERLAQVV